MSYDPSTTAILLVDPYNDFLSEGGKLWPRVKAVAEKVELLDHLRFSPPGMGYSLCRTIAGSPATTSLSTTPRHTSSPGLTRRSRQRQLGRTFHDDFQPQPGDVVVHEHWGSSGYANTDLDLQLKQHGVRRLILIGMIANTIEFDRPLRHGAWVPCHAGQGRHRRLQP